MNKKTWIIFVAVCIAILGGLIFLSRSNQVNVSSINEAGIITASKENGNIADHVFGTTSGKKILIEYGDFQCPACKSAHPNVKELTEQYKDKLTFIFRNLPLTSLHPNARAGAAAAEAAGLQGKYWEMHDALYENQDSWSGSSIEKRTSFFKTYAQQIGIKDLNKFTSDMESKSVSEKINFDMSLSKKIGATATPTIILDGKRIEPATWNDKDKFSKAIEEALK
ncbi:MAG: thioredoxin domain-containing protein [Candidatus Saccharimonadales bacterium]